MTPPGFVQATEALLESACICETTGAGRHHYLCPAVHSEHILKHLLARPDLLVQLAIESGALRQVDVRWELDEEAQRRHKDFRFNIAIDVTDPNVPVYVLDTGESDVKHRKEDDVRS